MTKEEFDDIIRHSEVSQVQFKERIYDNYDIGTEMVAFSNCRGGRLVIGVKDKTGVKNPLSYIVEVESNKAEEPRPCKGSKAEVESNKAEDLSADKSNKVIDKSNQGKYQSKVTNKQKDILNFCSVPRSAQEIMDRVGVENQTNNRKRYIQAWIDMGCLRPLFPDTLTASNQKYVRVSKK